MMERRERGWFGLATCLSLSLLVGCGEERPAFIDDSSPNSRGGSSSKPDDDPNPIDTPSPSGGGEGGATDGGGATGGKGGTGGGGGSPPGSSGFDSADVYFTGTIYGDECHNDFGTPISGNCYYVSSVRNPDQVIYGFYKPWAKALWMGGIVYRTNTQVFEFVPDRWGQVTVPESNDQLLDEADCGDEEPGYFITTPGGRLLYSCGDAVHDYYEDGARIYEGEHRVIRIVNDDLALISSLTLEDNTAAYGVLRLSTGEARPIEGLPAIVDVLLTTRAAGDGFRLVIQPVRGEPSELWNVTPDGSAEKLGTYPRIGEGSPRERALGADDTYYTYDVVDGTPVLIAANVDTEDYEIIHRLTTGPLRVIQNFFTSL